MSRLLDRLRLAWRVLIMRSPTYVLVYDDPSADQDGGQEQYYGFFGSLEEVRTVGRDFIQGLQDAREDDYAPHVALVLEDL